jgi:hypothetical protein
MYSFVEQRSTKTDKQKNLTKTLNFPTYWEVLGSNIDQGTRGHGFVLGYITALPERAEGNHGIPQSRHTVFGKSHEIWTSGTRSGLFRAVHS